MKTNKEMQIIVTGNKNIILGKLGCRYTESSLNLINELIERDVLDSFEVYYLGIDFDNSMLTELVTGFGWQKEDYSSYCSKPQVFINGEYIGTNEDFYNSVWNMGDDNGIVKSFNGDNKKAPRLTNPMSRYTTL